MNTLRIIDNFVGQLVAVENEGFMKVTGSRAIKLKKFMSKDEWERFRAEECVAQSIVAGWLTLLSTKEKRMFFIFHVLDEYMATHKPRILELGSGNGHIGALLSSAGYDIALSDYTSNGMFAKLEQFVKCRSQTLDFTKLKKDDLSPYDVVLAV